ncbi:methyl-accepting chemotaxis protein [Marinobacterium sp. D7]|uniref:methyl-accepting chemotaxis protein n=1 Tax=Marinobacterium ramblicola TaxID=2849041 RepID=UPI001C2CEB73|nr:methyl-accepting chemotaxis protein [Marinobacterium ramblicola]MBV1788680.1 methyl-accepting chemotaxis protein [Marinobacterium ramblicola]
MKFLGRYSIGTKLLVTPALVTALLILVAAAAYYGLKTQNGALKSIYETRIQRLLTTTSGINDVRSINEDLFLLRADFQSAFEAGETSFDYLQADVDAIRQGILTAREAFQAASQESGISEDEQVAYNDMLTALSGYGDSLEPFFEMVVGGSTPRGDGQFTMVWSWFGNFLNAARRLNEIQERYSGEDYEAAIHLADQAVTLLAGAVCLAVVLSLACAIAIRAQIVGAVNAIRTAAHEMQSGDLTHRVLVVGRDEVAQSGQAFNQLVDGFQALVKTVLGGAQELASSAQSLTVDTHEATRGAAQQSEATEAVAATMEQMSSSIISISSGTEQVRESAAKSLQATLAGREALEKMNVEAERVQRSFGEIQASVEDFLQRTAAISDLTRQVKEIAEQTNLLALNAAIEAARAGELGRGFAVVADEVRKLAEHSSTSASNIEEVTAALDGRSKAVYTSLQSGHRSLSSTLDQLDVLYQTMVTAGEAVETTTREIDGIAAAVKEQSEGGTHIARKVDDIAKMVEKNAGLVVDTASAAVRLEQLAANLETSVVHFRI